MIRVDPNDPLLKICDVCGDRMRTPDPPERCHCSCENLASKKAKSLPATGVGYYLKRLFAEDKITPTGGCGCDGIAAKLNALGPDWCEANTDEIIASMRAGKNWRWRVPFAETYVRGKIREAIEMTRAESTACPGRDS